SLVNVPGCPVHTDNFLEILLNLLYQGAGRAPPIPPSDLARPTWLFAVTVHEGRDRAGAYEQAGFAAACGAPLRIGRPGCAAMARGATGGRDSPEDPQHPFPQAEAILRRLAGEGGAAPAAPESPQGGRPAPAPDRPAVARGDGAGWTEGGPGPAAVDEPWKA